MTIDVVSLRDESGLRQLKSILSERQAHSGVTEALISQLLDLGVVSMLVEHDYLDRDFSEAYSAYFARTFRRHSKRCKRLLFFKNDVDFVHTDPNPKSVAERLQVSQFAGFIVLRPISRAPVSQAIIETPPAPCGFEGKQLVCARYSAHVLGAELFVTAVPMTQQDARTGSCAQATIWTVARYFHARHRGLWMSTVAISQAATTHAGSLINAQLPAGSEFLTPDAMLSALRATGRVILRIDPQGYDGAKTAAIISRYIDSGIPIIAGMAPDRGAVGHAVVITGQVLQPDPRCAPGDDQPSRRPTMAEFCQSFYVVDDQIGPNVRMPVEPRPDGMKVPVGEGAYNVTGITYLIVPLPDKVYLSAETAELAAWATIRNYVKDWQRFKGVEQGTLESSVELGDQLVTELKRGKTLARTYLTPGWKYKARGIRNLLPLAVQRTIQTLDLPRWVYVTEFTTIDVASIAGKGEPRVFAHCVVDATAKLEEAESVLFFHAPGYCSYRAYDDVGVLQNHVAAVPESRLYFAKERGVVPACPPDREPVVENLEAEDA